MPLSWLILWESFSLGMKLVMLYSMLERWIVFFGWCSLVSIGSLDSAYIPNHLFGPGDLVLHHLLDFKPSGGSVVKLRRLRWESYIPWRSKGNLPLAITELVFAPGQLSAASLMVFFSSSKPQAYLNGSQKKFALVFSLQLLRFLILLAHLRWVSLVRICLHRFWKPSFSSSSALLKAFHKSRRSFNSWRISLSTTCHSVWEWQGWVGGGWMGL